MTCFLSQPTSSPKNQSSASSGPASGQPACAAFLRNSNATHALTVALERMIDHNRLAQQARDPGARRVHCQAGRYYRKLATTWERIARLRGGAR